jgi:hypothetical protein
MKSNDRVGLHYCLSYLSVETIESVFNVRINKLYISFHVLDTKDHGHQDYCDGQGPDYLICKGTACMRISSNQMHHCLGCMLLRCLEVEVDSIDHCPLRYH